MTTMRPQLARDVLLSELIYPCWGQAKIDGVRGLNMNGQFTGRSLKPFDGYLLSEYFSRPKFMGLDGEIIVGTNPASQERLCSITSGATDKFKGITEMADFHWWVFDYITPSTQDLSYESRYAELERRVAYLDHPRVHLVPYELIENEAQAKDFIDRKLAEGYEGAIFRNPRAKAKEGRPTVKGQQLMRFKPWEYDTEFLITGFTEGNKNTNEAIINPLGRTERSSAQEGMVPNGQVGTLHGTLIKDVHSSITGELLFKKGLKINVNPGEMTVEEAIDYFNNPHKIVGKIGKMKHMIIGVKDKPRLAIFTGLRNKTDMDEV